MQDAPIVAYPKAEGYTRITDYGQFQAQNRPGTSYAVEYPTPYEGARVCGGPEGREPYYPVLTRDSMERYAGYRAFAEKIPNLVVCGRLGDFQYYNMDQALKRALEISIMMKKQYL